MVKPPDLVPPLSSIPPDVLQDDRIIRSMLFQPRSRIYAMIASRPRRSVLMICCTSYVDRVNGSERLKGNLR